MPDDQDSARSIAVATPSGEQEPSGEQDATADEVDTAAPTTAPDEVATAAPTTAPAVEPPAPTESSPIVVPGQEVRPKAPSAPATPPGEPVRGLSYAVDLVFCIDVTGSMTPILDTVKANALRFYDDVQRNLTDKGKHIDELRVRIIAFRDFNADPESAVTESSFFALPDERSFFSGFVDGLVAEGGGDAPESGLEAVALAINSPWTSRGDRRRQVIVVWTDQPAHPLGFAVLPPSFSSSVPRDFSALTDLWEDPQGPVGASSKRLILFAPDAPGWSDISASWENVVHLPSEAGGGLSEVDYGTIIDSIGNSV